MLIVFILIGILSVNLLFLILAISSTVRIEIRELEADNIEGKEKILKGYLFYIHLYWFNKIRWVTLKIDNEFKEKTLVKMIKRKMGFKKEKEIEILKEFLIKNKKELFSKKTIRYLKDLNIHVSRIHLSLDIGTKNTIFTAFTVTFISSAISILLGNTARNSKSYYVIRPLYLNKNIFKINVNCIINVKMVHIINMLYVLLKKRSENKYGGTPNRRTYGYSYE